MNKVEANRRQAILKQIKTAVYQSAPDATLILYGSYARGDYHENSDLDLLILVNREEVTRADQKRIKYPLYDIEIETGTIISPMIFSKKAWQSRHRATPFYENVSREGQEL